MKLFARMLVAALLSLALAACRAPADHAAQPSSEIRLYHVPAQQSGQIAGALGVLLAGNGKNDMGVTRPFPGTLMVLAPPKVQANVGSAIAALAKASTAGAGPESLQVHFWLVAAVPGQGVDDPALKPLAATLQRLQASLGPSHFTVKSAVSAAGTMGEHGEIIGNGQRQFNFKPTPGQGDAIDLQVEYSRMPGPANGIHFVSTTVLIPHLSHPVIRGWATLQPSERMEEGSCARTRCSFRRA